MNTDPIDPLVRQSFGASLPEDARQAMRRELAGARSDWRARAEKPRSLFAAHPRTTWLAAAASLLVLALGGAHWARTRAPAAQAAAPSSYICATARFPEKSAMCTAVFHSAQNPDQWTERRIVMLGPDGNLTQVIAYNPERNSI